MPSAAADSPDLLYYLRHLPGFISPPRPSIDSDAIQYLSAQGALDLPQPSVQNALLREFFNNVHPQLPVLDLNSFLESVCKPDGSSGRISLLLFQAVLSAGTAYVGMRYLVDAGFQTRHEAHWAFSRKVRLLYNFDFEGDRACLVQTLLLMTLCCNDPQEHRNASYWLDVAISQAFAAKLHLEPSTLDAFMSLRAQRLRRRIWWSCILQDQLTVLNNQRLPRIRKEDHNVRMLQEDDFFNEHCKFKHRRIRSLCSLIDDPKRLRDLAIFYVAQARLCQSLQSNLGRQINISETSSTLSSSALGKRLLDSMGMPWMRRKEQAEFETGTRIYCDDGNLVGLVGDIGSEEVYRTLEAGLPPSSGLTISRLPIKF